MRKCWLLDFFLWFSSCISDWLGKGLCSAPKLGFFVTQVSGGEATSEHKSPTKPPKGEKPLPEHKPPTPIGKPPKGEKPLPEHKSPTPVGKPPEGEKHHIMVKTLASLLSRVKKTRTSRLIRLSLLQLRKKTQAPEKKPPTPPHKPPHKPSSPSHPN
ncbi:hypothetical protein CK203_042745 [Vitis vinifera]|uniref:Uncharacterized protein n=1 Tax=Vitis vinifera TaxID=29760 RepID=A0A438HQS3_VITVI|nr:hypothetical protein CK203_042745 [Vitis vinifera]